MIALLDNLIVWWHWFVAGLVLMIAEVLTGTFLLLGLGISAMVVGIIDFLFGTGFIAEAILWSLMATGVFALWKRHFQNAKHTDIGQSHSGIGTKGVITRPITPPQKGQVQLQEPLLGNSTWIATSDQPLTQGERVVVQEIVGQYLVVTKER